MTLLLIDPVVLQQVSFYPPEPPFPHFLSPHSSTFHSLNQQSLSGPVLDSGI